MRNLPFFQSVSTLVGTIIGAGILGMPYVFAKAGFWTGLLVLMAVTLAMVFIKLMIGEVTLRTGERHQLAGYIGHYLGPKWKILSLLISITIYGALLAYFLGVGQALSAIFGGYYLVYSIFFYILAAFFIYKGVSLIKNAEFFLSVVVLAIFFLIIAFSHGHMNLNNVSGFSFSSLFVPFGVILFACSGTLAIPEMRQILKHREYLLKRAILTGVIFSSTIYALFALVVVAVTGQFTTEIATIGLGREIGPIILIIGNLFAVFTMSTSFLSCGLALRDMFRYDFKLARHWPWLLVVIGPLVLYAFGWRDFIQIIGFAGALGFGFEGFEYILTYWKARKYGNRHPEYALNKHLAVAMSIYLVLIFFCSLGWVLVDVIK
jgi:tyrosine-specific transport protein